MASSRFQTVERAPPDVVFNVLAKFKEDTDPNKVNLSIGGKPQFFKKLSLARLDVY